MKQENKPTNIKGRTIPTECNRGTKALKRQYEQNEQEGDSFANYSDQEERVRKREWLQKQPRTRL